jgi:hypothetical protein
VESSAVETNFISEKLIIITIKNLLYHYNPIVNTEKLVDLLTQLIDTLNVCVEGGLTNCIVSWVKRGVPHV